MSDTSRFALPLLAAAQAQKHVTHNEALVRLDALAHLNLLSRSLAEPPPAPVDGHAEGSAYLVAGSASGDWSGREGDIALWLSGAWQFQAVFTGLVAFVADEEALIVTVDGVWRDVGPLLGPDRMVAQSSHGAQTRIAALEEELPALSGAYVETSALIPDRAIVFGVSCRTVTTITGAASYDCGVGGETSKFGGSLGIYEGATNAGVIGPTAVYAATPVRLTANGGDFTGGAVRIAVHCLLPVVPQS
ncbi:DUF2793 domain-containing protein [Roseibium algae]|uniref:DUF2793 domain-containing protein n=1 Tax=Roseibium algae TaxID=3123038 RepID=A0ABU8TIH5_9HYPH